MDEELQDQTYYSKQKSLFEVGRAGTMHNRVLFMQSIK